MNPVLEELGPKLGQIRNQLNNIVIRRTAPKVKRHNTKAKNASDTIPLFPSGDEGDLKKTGQAIYPVLVGEASNLYKTSKLPRLRLISVDLHRLSRDEVL